MYPPSDHGYHMGEHAHFQKRTLFEFSARIPLIISCPGMKVKGKVSHSFVEMIDLYPTLCDLAGLEYPSYLSGKCFAKILQNPRKKIRNDAFTQTVADSYSIITNKYRYTRWGEGGSGMLELYDKRNDPHEMVNLANKKRFDKIIFNLEKQLDARVKDVGKYYHY